MQREIRANLRLLSDIDRLAGDSYLGKTSFVWMWMDPFLMAKVFALSEQQRYSWFEKGEALKGWSVRLLTNPVEARRVSHSPSGGQSSRPVTCIGCEDLFQPNILLWILFSIFVSISCWDFKIDKYLCFCVQCSWLILPVLPSPLTDYGA